MRVKTVLAGLFSFLVDTFLAVDMTAFLTLTGLGVGVTDKLVNKYDAVKFAKLGSEIIGGKGGGGRKDFAQAGGQDKNKIAEAFEKLKALI